MTLHNERGQQAGNLITMAMVPTRSSDNVHEEQNEIPAKCARIEQREDKPAKNEISSLKDFAFVKLLWNDVSSKTVYVQGACRP